jgi:uncharacterized protein YndB with AHSA1/START domain
MSDVLQADGELIDKNTIRFQRLLPGPIERVWAYLTDPEKRATWFAGGELEPRVGGKNDLYFRHANLAYPDETPPEKYRNAVEGSTSETRITQYQPPRLLAWSWEWGGKPTEVVFELEPVGDNVQLTLTHRRLPTRENLLSVSGGWHLHLLMLESRLRGTKPPRFWDTQAKLEKMYDKRIPS